MASDSPLLFDASSNTLKIEIGVITIASIALAFAIFKIFRAIRAFFWPDIIGTYHRWINHVCERRLATMRLVEESQLSEIRQRSRNGQQLADITQGSVLTKVINSVHK
jgi:hypothetical protein